MLLLFYYFGIIFTDNLNILIMKEKQQSIINEIKDLIFEDLKNFYDYWGENNMAEMIDFCNRNKIHLHQKILTNLLHTVNNNKKTL